MITTMKDLVDISTNGYLKLNPSKPQVSIGLGTCGLAAGGEPLYKAILRFKEDRGLDFEIVNVGCIGMCFAEPLVDVKLPGMPRVTYADVDLCKLERILEDHLVGGTPVKELAMAQLSEDISECEVGRISYETSYEGIPSYRELPFFKKQMRIALRNCGIIDPEDIEQYIARGGYRSAYEILHGRTPDSVIDEVKSSGIRGRGGAGFPTGMKWSFARQAKGDKKYIICNADEGDPGAYMDRAVLEGDPHSVLEGMIIGGFAIGSDSGYIYCRAEYPLAIRRLRTAIAQAEEMGILGDNVLGSGFSFRIIIMEGAGAFVCGEETALIASIMGKRGEPRPRPPFPATHGLFGKPTNVNNVETWANIPLIFRKGGKWFAGIGTEKSTGTKVFSLVGQINRAGLVEIPMGTTLKDIIYEIGGGMQRERAFKAVQTGGPSGGCIPAQHLDVQITYESLKELGSIMGSGGMVAMNEDNCMVDVARYFLSFTAEESCGQCVPCRVGTRRMLQILERITEGDGGMEDIGKLEHLAVQVRDGSLCALGGSAPNPVLTTLRYFRKEFEDHIKKGKCEASVCANLFLAPCQNTCPAGTNVPGFISLISEGKYVDAYALNKEDNPFPSVCGRICDHPCESRCNRNQLDGNLNVWALKRYCADRAYALSRDDRPKPSRLGSTGKKVAVVGGGPSGLSAAYFLSRLGNKVTIYESSDRLGGMMRWGIPRYRLPRDVMDAEIQDILDLGVEVMYNVKVGDDVLLPELANKYDAVYLAPGAQSDIRLNLENEDFPGVIHGMELLNKLNRGEKVEMGSSILIIGGGNVSVDVARNAIREGVPKVTICYRRERQDMPAYPEEIEEALREGVEFKFLVEPSRLIVDNGRVVGAEFTRMKMGDYNKWGRRVPIPTGEKMAVYADNVITAVGQMVDPDFAAGSSEKIVTDKNLVEIDEDSRTKIGKVYSGGDAVLGPATAIEAIGTGKKAAMKIDEMLSGRERFPELRKASKLNYRSDTPDNQGHMERQEPPTLPLEQRRGCNAEVILCYSEEQARFEAKRCLRCDLSCRGDEE